MSTSSEGTDTALAARPTAGQLKGSRVPTEGTAEDPVHVALIPDGAAVSWLWKVMVGGLVGLSTLALIGLIYVIADADPDTSPDVLVTVFSSTVTGLIGLFVRSPV